MFDFLFAQYETSIIRTAISFAIALYIVKLIAFACNRLSDKNPFGAIAKVFKGIALDIEIFADWIKGYRYYDIDPAFFPPYYSVNYENLKVGSVVIVMKHRFPYDNSIHPCRKRKLGRHVVKKIDYVSSDRKRGLIRLAPLR